MKRLILLVLLLLPVIASAQVAYQGSNFVANATVQGTISSAGWDLILEVIGTGGTSAGPSVADSAGDTALTDFAYSYDSASQIGIGVYRVHDASINTHVFSVTWTTAPPEYFLVLVAATNVGSVDTGAGSLAITTGNSGTVTTGSLSPTMNGDMLLASFGNSAAASETLGSWTNSFTLAQSFTGQPTFALAYLDQATAASVNTSVTLSQSSTWAALLIAYKPATVAPSQKGGMFFAAKTLPRRIGLHTLADLFDTPSVPRVNRQSLFYPQAQETHERLLVLR